MAQDRKIKGIFSKKNNFQHIDSSLLITFLQMMKESYDAYVLTKVNTDIIEVSSAIEINIKKNNSLLQYIDIQSQKEYTDIIKKVKLNESTSSFNLRFVRSKKIYKTKCTKIIDENEVEYLIFTLINNTINFELSEELKLKEEQFRAIINHTESWENWINPEGDLIFVNPAIENYTGYSIEESIWLFQHPEKYIHKDDYKRVVRKFNKCLNAKKPETDIFRIRKKDNSIIWIFSSWNPVFSDEKKYLGIRSSIHDITEVKETQKLLEENIIKLEKLNIKLNEANIQIEESYRNAEIFVTNMSHLVRTPLNAILGMTEMLYSSNLNEVEIEMIDVIEKSAENLLIVINDIVDIKKIESKNIDLDNKGIHIYKQIQSLYNISKSEALRKNLELNVSFPFEYQDLIIKTDPVRFNQVFLNIINNAVKYTYRGTINFDTKVIKENEEEVSMEFKIIDTGIGISEKKLTHIFTGFTRLGTHATKKITGSGLGLFICKQLVDLMNGEINVESTEGKGSVFTVQFTFKKGSETDIADRKKFKSNLEEKQKSLQNINLLLVEDQEFNQLLIKKITDAWQCNLEIVSNGKDAIEMLKAKKFDAVLMDIQLPVMSGIQATKIIRNELHEPIKSIPIIALTANAIEGDEEKYLEAGMNDYLPKPFRSHVLYEMITRNLNIDSKKDKIMESNSEKTKSNLPLYSLEKIMEIAKGDESYVTEMIMVFIDQCVDIKSHLVRANTVKNVKEIGSNAHKLKSSINIMLLHNIEKEVIEIVELSRNDEKNPKIFELSEFVVQKLALIIPALKNELKTGHYKKLL